MRLHEYQAKELFARYGIPVPRGEVAETPAQAGNAAFRLGGRVALKAQVHAGGRGRAGGIYLATSDVDAGRWAATILGQRLVTAQTGPQGVPVRRLLVEQSVEVQRELYLAIILDPSRGVPLLMASAFGGTEIEEVAARSPEAILQVPIDPIVGFQPFQGRRIAYGLGLEPAQVQPAVTLMANLYRLFMDQECSLVEINPLVITAQGQLLALDAKVTIEDNALYRHPDLEALRDVEQEDPLEVQARNYGIQNYIKLTGDIGCVVNGAGLAMATMDLIKLAGGEPANFLDIGTVNDVNRVINAFRLLTADPEVKAIFINIFGGLARVDIIADGIISSFREMEVKVPVVTRLAGTNVAEGKRMLAEAELPIVQVDNLAEAAAAAVRLAKEGRR